MSRLRQAIIALGTNLGERRANLSKALDLLKKSPGIEAVIPSPIYETAPVGITDQPPFLNLVAGIRTRLSPEDLMKLLLQTEQKMGRVRLTRWGPRLIDLDLLFFEQEERNDPQLVLPHPRWSERAFVTVPLKDLLAHPAFALSAWEPVRRQLHELPPRDGDVKRLDSKSDV